MDEEKTWFDMATFLLVSILIPAWAGREPPMFVPDDANLATKPPTKWEIHSITSRSRSHSHNDSVVVGWKGMLKLKAGNIGGHCQARYEPENVHEATWWMQRTLPGSDHRVVRTYGGWGWKQRYQGEDRKSPLHPPLPMEPGDLGGPTTFRTGTTRTEP
jgi:hypothetical protein